MNLATALEVTIKWQDSSKVFVASCQVGELTGIGKTRTLALKNFEKKCQDAENAGGGLIEVHFGVGNSDLFLIRGSITAGQLILDTDISEKLGFNPFNVRAVVDGHPLNAEDLIKPHSEVHIETNASTKGFSLPKEHEVKRFLKRSEEHTSELQSPDHLVCRLLLEKK